MLGAIIGDIVGGMAEAIWGVPETIKAQALEYLPAEMRAVYERFEAQVKK